MEKLDKLESPTPRHERLEDVLLELIAMIRPPERTTVSEAAAKYRKVYSPGAPSGPWSNDLTPYMVEPMDAFTDREIKGLIFVGPAQSGKTDALIINTVAYCVKVDPMDMMVYCPTQKAARDFSIRRVDRLHQHSPEVGAMIMPDRDADNTFDKRYKTGMILTLSYPTVTELAGRPVGRIVMTDYDRMDDDVGGDGSPYDLGSQRTNTFGSLGITVAESSPSRPVEDPLWIPKTAHEAPPCRGIIELYNRGDRRRWYWPCPHCDAMFEGEFKYLTWDGEDSQGNPLSTLAKAETVKMACPSCGCLIHPDDRHEMNLWGEWLPDGMTYDLQGRKQGHPVRNMTRSYWLKGVAAAFTTWKKLVVEFLDAEDSYRRTLSEEALKKFYNNNLGEPYLPKSLHNIRTPEAMRANAEPLPPRQVAEGVRFLMAAADVQKDRFAVMVWGIMAGEPFDMMAVDRFDLPLSYRTDEHDNRLPLDPAAYVDDWHVLKKEVMQKAYPLSDGSGRHMQIRMTFCDSGGRAGVTTNAYNFYRQLREENAHGRFLLVKGTHNPNAPRVHESYPDSNRKDRNAGARGDIPVLMINSNVIKDTLDGRLGCTLPGRGMVRFPDWFADDFFNEMCAEIRGPKGWENKNSERNEAWDLACYIIAGALSRFINAERLSWDNPPAWAAQWDANALVAQEPDIKRFVARKRTVYDLGKLAEQLA